MSTTPLPEAAKPPASRISIRPSEKAPEQTVFMSFGLLNELTPLVGGPERMAEFDFDARLREHVMKLCLASRDAQRKIPEDYQLPEDLEMEEAERLMDWVKEHVLNFFIRRLIRNLKDLRDNEQMLRMAENLPPRTG